MPPPPAASAAPHVRRGEAGSNDGRAAHHRRPVQELRRRACRPLGVAPNPRRPHLLGHRTERRGQDDAYQRADRLVGALPYGRQRMVEIARALISKPILLLLDEPAAGLNSSEVERLRGILDGLRTQGLTLVLVEHNMGLVMRVADRIAVISFG